MTPLLLNVTEAAKLMGVSRWSVSEMCRRFTLPWIPRGRKGRLIATADIERWIRESKVNSPEELRKALDGRRVA